jgi:hypothetical protein
MTTQQQSGAGQPAPFHMRAKAGKKALGASSLIIRIYDVIAAACDPECEHAEDCECGLTVDEVHDKLKHEIGWDQATAERWEQSRNRKSNRKGRHPLPISFDLETVGHVRVRQRMRTMRTSSSGTGQQEDQPILNGPGSGASRTNPGRRKTRGLTPLPHPSSRRLAPSGLKSTALRGETQSDPSPGRYGSPRILQIAVWDCECG